VVPQSYLVELLRQILFIAVVLAGFSVTAGIGGTREDGKRGVVVFFRGAMLLASALMVVTVCVAAVGLTLQALEEGSSGESGGVAFLYGAITITGRCLMIGMGCFLAGIGLSGWTASKALGLFSTGTALLAAFGVVLSIRYLATLGSSGEQLIHDLLY